MTKVIVFHTAWMEKYNGDLASLNAGGFDFAQKHGYGHEIYNFRNIDGHCYGYVPPTGNLHFENHFDVPKNIQELKDVTVVWTAPHPEGHGRAVVGVWRHATVYRKAQIPVGVVARRRSIKREIADYRVMAAGKDCYLLPFEARPIFMPTRKSREGESWPGQQKVFYPKANSSALRRLNQIIRMAGARDFLNRINGSQNKRSAKRSKWQIDVEKRQMIEKAAIDVVGFHLEAAGFLVKSVEKENLGYDLLATRGCEVLNVEVKGRSGGEIAADLSVNEFDCLTRYQRRRNPEGHYRIAIVTDALRKPVIHEFIFVPKVKGWRTLNGQLSLQLEERKAARLTALSIASSG